MNDGIGDPAEGFTEGFGEMEMGVQGAMDLTIVGEVNFEGMDFVTEGSGKWVQVQVEDVVVLGEEVGNDKLAGFTGATGDDDAFGHSGGCKGVIFRS